MKFSVVIPLYNGAKFIEATLDTVLSQTYKNYEIILINDESPDNVEEVVKKYMFLHPEAQFVYHKQKNRGLGGARNTAIRNATGEIIAILDQDDIWYPDKLEKVFRLYKDNPDIDVVCHGQKVRQDGKVIGIFRPRSCIKDMYRELLFYNNRLSTSAVTFKKSVIDDVGFFLEDKSHFHFVEDYDMWIRMAGKGYKFYFTDQILGEYTRHSANFSTQLEDMLRSELNVLQRHFNDFKHSSIWDFYLMKRRIALLYVRFFRNYFKQKRFLNAAKYLIKAFIKDPFFMSYYLEQLLAFLRIQKEAYNDSCNRCERNGGKLFKRCF